MSNQNTSIAIKLPAIAWEIVRLLLQQPGWAVTPRDICVAGALEDKLTLPKRPEPDKTTGKLDPAEDEKWSAALVEHDLLPKEHEVIAKCIRASVGKRSVGGGKMAALVMQAFLSDEC